MKMRLLFIPAVMVLFIAGACSVQELDLAENNELSKELVFVAQSGELDTKTAFQSDETSIWWSPADEISIFYGASSGNKFIANNTEEVARAEFHGTLNAFTGESEAGEAYYFWAVYPYSSANSCDGSSVTVTLSDQQVAKAGTFAPNTNISIAKSTGLNLAFFNTCSWFRFSLKKEGVKRVVFRGNNNEDVAGQFSVSMDGDGRPTAPTVLDGKKEIVLTMPEDAAFATGQMYYITLLPQVFQSGFTVTFETDGETGSRSISATATYLRSKYNTGVEFDKTVEYVSIVPGAVDMGLSVRWAATNLGAESPEADGDYYAWGGQSPYYTSLDPLIWKDGKTSGYTESSYNWLGGKYTRYGKPVLDLEDDVARVQLGQKWRMPTKAEFEELKNTENCTWEWVNQNGVNGRKVTSKITGASIFLPASGYWDGTSLENHGSDGFYWSSSLYTDSYSYGNNFAWLLPFGASGVIIYQDYRFRGMSVRPVWADIVPVSGISMISSYEIMVGERYQPLVVFTPDDATNKELLWSSDNEAVVSIDNGEWVAHSLGVANITATSADGGHIATCKVTAHDPVLAGDVPLTGISMISSLTLVEGEEYVPTVNYSPANAYNKNLIWHSSNDTVIDFEDGKWVAKSVGVAQVTATSVDAGHTATCQVTVNPAMQADFNPNSYLIWKRNRSGGWDSKNENCYYYESYLNGFRATSVEMKFQLASSSATNITIGSDNSAKDEDNEMFFTSTEFRWNKCHKYSDNEYYSISLSEAGITRTSLITLSFDGSSKVLTINGRNFTTPYSSFEFDHLFVEYFRENDEGVCMVYEGVPDYSKVYYVKGWDGLGNLIYLGYPTTSVNPDTSHEENCWYSFWQKKTTYMFANDSVHQGGFGAYLP